MKKLVCTLCGHPINYTPGKVGRPNEFCLSGKKGKSSDCRRLWNMFPWMEELIEKIDRKGIEPAKKTQLRSRLFSMSNLLNNKK